MPRPLKLLTLSLLVLVACPPANPGVPPRPLAGLLIACEPADAVLLVDDRYLGSVTSLRTTPLMLPDGFHRLELRRDGYFSHFAEVTLVKGVRQQLEVKLRREPF
jgi:hypothetical protein